MSADISSIWKQNAPLQKQKELTFLRCAKHLYYDVSPSALEL